MRKLRTFLALIFITGSHDFGQQLSAEDYKVYAAITKTEIRDSTTSIAILKNGIDSLKKAESTQSTLTDLTSIDKYLIYRWTEDYKRARPTSIDSNSAKFMVDYCKSKTNKFSFTKDFNQPYKTTFLEKFPIRAKSAQKDWNSFYKKYPGSGGIFAFSNIKYYSDDSIAILYYWVRRAGLSGHGALALLTKNNNVWQMKYKTYLWWN